MLKLIVKGSGASFVVLALVSIAAACNIPVFRYALERWRPDACDLIVFHDKSLSDQDDALVAKLQKLGDATRKVANLQTMKVNLSSNAIELREYQDLWLDLKSKRETSLPFVVVRSSIGEGRKVNNWLGSLNEVEKSGVLESPKRTELIRRLLKGDAVVWILVKSKDESKSKAAHKLLADRIQSLSQELELPEGLGLPGSELFSDVPLLLDFSILEIDPADSQEKYLVDLFHGFEPDSVASGDPLVVPVFGRGRALEVIPASRLDAGLIGDLARFLCGACSCQVKEKNPGFDLLLTNPWDEALFGATGTLPPAETNKTPDEPKLLPIPPGRKKK
jgi:hypothetical protein